MTPKKKTVPRTAPPAYVDGPDATPSVPDSTEASPPTPDDPANAFAVVGIGASAGGLAAFEAFFSGMPVDTDPDMAFVLVQHLDPDHKSLLTELIRRYTRMQVFEVEDGMVVRPNCAYIIPPNRDMAFFNGTLQLMEPLDPRGRRLPIDYFFKTLAQDQHERAICVVLSGTGSDGTLGVRAIKGEGGMAIAQSPASTTYDGMPRSALATGLVDFELAPAEMPARIMAYVARAFGRPQARPSVPVSGTESTRRKIYVLLRAQTGHDFSQYKPSTVHRRIERRMALLQLESIGEYVAYMQRTPTEVEALFRDLLIGVTSFFRDPEAFAELQEHVIPKIAANAPPGSVIRVWTTGCSTGEEAYSLAMLLHEHFEALKLGHTAQIFATDIDSEAIATARMGRYPASIAADVSAERLARFFTPESDGEAFRINKNIRDMLIFSEQNVIKDPPFSRLDLLSCRNLLIYMGGDLQKKVIPLFHYALKPGGILFLGTSETVDEHGDLFGALDRKLKIYQRRPDLLRPQHLALGRVQAPLAALDMPLPRAAGRPTVDGKLPLRELTEKALLQHAVGAAALVNAAGDILYLHGRTGLYLEPSPGEAGINNILKMAREGLRRDLTVALHKCKANGEPVVCAGLRVRTNGDFSLTDLTITPVPTGPATAADTTLYLVTLAEAPPREAMAALTNASMEAVAGPAGPTGATDPRIAVLRQELRAKEEYLQTANEELETANEELKSSNEEMQSVNEELQSTNEELETSKEELQSVNEELATVNAELQAKVADLTRANNDMNNLLAGTGIGTVFVDHQMRILRFTPAATRIINLIPGDVGRPVGHLVSNLMGHGDLMGDVQDVLATLVPRNLDVQTKAGLWYTMRIQPYRTLENLIEGAVLTFVDITDMKKVQEELQASVSGFRQIAQSLPQLVWTCRPDGHLDFVGPQWLAFSGLPEADLLGYRWLDQVHADDRAELLLAWNASLAAGTQLRTEFRLRRHDGEYLWFDTRATALRDAKGQVSKWFGINIDITGQRAGESAADG